MTTPESRSILKPLIAIRGSDLREELLDVMISQDGQQVCLVTVTSTETKSTALDFIYSHDAPVFAPDAPIEENIALFLGMADIESLCMTTDLIKIAVCEACLK